MTARGGASERDREGQWHRTGSQLLSWPMTVSHHNACLSYGAPACANLSSTFSRKSMFVSTASYCRLVDRCVLSLLYLFSRPLNIGVVVSGTVLPASMVLAAFSCRP